MMLTKAGYKVEVANNGKETVAKYTRSPEDFDLVFMDVHMPEMDGMEATSAIRNWEEAHLSPLSPNQADDGRQGMQNPESKSEIRKVKSEIKRVPIVAITAAARKGDREKCLEAGMNDYIAKPIKREQVFEILEKWVFGKGSLGTSTDELIK